MRIAVLISLYLLLLSPYQESLRARPLQKTALSTTSNSNTLQSDSIPPTNSAKLFASTYYKAPEKALEETLAERAHTPHKQHELCKLYLLSAEIYLQMGLYNKAFEDYNQALKISLDNRLSLTEANCYLGIGQLYAQQNLDSLSIKYYIQARELFEMYQNHPGQARVLKQLALLYQHRGNTAKAESYFNQAIKIYTHMEDAEKLFHAACLQSRLHQQEGDYSKAFSANRRAIEFAQKTQNPNLQAKAHQNTAKLYHHFELYLQATNEYSIALNGFKEQENTIETAATYILLGDNYKQHKAPVKALDAYQQASRISQEHKITQSGYQAATKLAHLYDSLGQTEQALRYYKLGNSLYQQIHNSQLIKAVASTEILKEHKASQTKINFLNKKNSSQSKKIKQQKSLVFIQFLFLLAALFAGFMAFRNNRLHHRINQSIARQNAETERLNSQLKENNLQLIESEKKLNQALATKNRFFTIIAHDLRNPFQSLLGLTQILDLDYDQLPDTIRKTYIGHIHNAAQQAFKLLSNLLDWSQLQTGHLKPQPTSFHLLDLCKETCSILALHAESKQISINVSIDEDLQVYADQNMVKTIIRNLISNAIKFTPSKGKIEVQAKVTESLTEVLVEDNGRGIHPEELSALFEVKNKVKNKNSSREKGTGLGLILCREFVEANHGSIRAESQPQKGSRFIFTLPKAPVSTFA